MDVRVGLNTRNSQRKTRIAIYVLTYRQWMESQRGLAACDIL